MSNGTKATAVSVEQLGNRQLSPVNELKKYLDKLKPSIAAALPKHLNADRMARLVMTEFSKNASLRQCKFESIAACIMTASQLGLEIGVGGQAYMIPYGEIATLVPGWKGLVDLVARAGRSSVWTGAVFEGDVFDWELGDSPFLKHKPMGENDADKMLFAYAIGRVNGSDHPIIECWPNKRIRKHFDKNVISSLKKNHYANKHWEMYARKVVLLQVLKYLPQSIELQAAVDAAHASDQGRSLSIDADFVTIEQQVVPEVKVIAESHDLPADASPRLTEWWNAMAAKSDEREIAALCDEASEDSELTKAEKQVLFDESKRRNGA